MFLIYFGIALRRLGMFDGVIDSRQLRRARSRSSSQPSSSSSSTRATERDLEVARLQEALRQQQEFQERQMAWQRSQSEYYAAQLAQQQQFLQVRVYFLYFAFSLSFFYSNSKY
jgi:hypothetical protein